LPSTTASCTWSARTASPARLDLPNSADKGVHREWLTMQLREPLVEGGKTFPAGSLIATNFDAFLAGKREWTVLFTPTPTVSLASATWTRDYLLLNLLEDVKSRVEVLYPVAGEQWHRSGLPGTEDIVDLTVVAVDADTSNEYFLTSTSFLTPTSLSMGEAGVREPELLKQLPAWFDATGMVVTQHFATSKDGTRIPYFMVAGKDVKLDGSNPTLLYGYGGFEVSETPNYSGSIGRWVGQGGVYVLANIRGGGEYGPAWHKAALRENRLRAYEDFAAVAQDLIARKVTTPRHLGIQGGSNGGLAGRQHAGAVSAAVRRGRGAGAAARHAALQPPARRRLVDGRVRRSRRARRLGLHQDLLALPQRAQGRGLPAGAVHHVHARRPRAPGPRAQDDGAHAGAGARCALLREHRGRPRRRCEQRAGRVHAGPGLDVPETETVLSPRCPTR
jgi:hypothetical protein